MIFVKLSGGLGNQMFQYAFAYYLADLYDTNILVDSVILEHHINNRKKTIRKLEIDKYFCIPFKKFFKYRFYWGLPIIIIYRIILKPYLYLNNIRIVKQSPHETIEKYLKTGDNSYIDGVWVSDVFFNKIAPKIKELYTFNIKLTRENIEIIEKIINSNAISIHVRRGDYLSEQNKDTYNILTMNYYNNAIELLKLKIKRPQFFIFSDDIEWCKQNLANVENVTYIDWNTGDSAPIDMYLMSLCKHNIIANSSFSWWGAWLNNNPEKIVIMPGEWFGLFSTLPQGWISVHN